MSVYPSYIFNETQVNPIINSLNSNHKSDYESKLYADIQNIYSILDDINTKLNNFNKSVEPHIQSPSISVEPCNVVSNLQEEKYSDQLIDLDLVFLPESQHTVKSEQVENVVSELVVVDDNKPTQDVVVKRVRRVRKK